jgi:hypothetical protein
MFCSLTTVKKLALIIIMSAATYTYTTSKKRPASHMAEMEMKAKEEEESHRVRQRLIRLRQQLTIRIRDRETLLATKDNLEDTLTQLKQDYIAHARKTDLCKNNIESIKKELSSLKNPQEIIKQEKRLEILKEKLSKLTTFKTNLETIMRDKSRDYRDNRQERWNIDFEINIIQNKIDELRIELNEMGF